MGRVSGQSEFWFERRDELVMSSARMIVPIVNQAISPQSVLDVGCGTGTWLAAWLEAGVRDTLGLEQSPEAIRLASSDNGKIQLFDLTCPQPIDQRFDLAMCLEVAEHLPCEQAGRLLDLLVKAADVVLFSAAVPGQGGFGHVNERWQHEWAEEFGVRGYRCYDIVRPKVWNEVAVLTWYAQNTLLYVNENRAAQFHLGGCTAVSPILSVVHPNLFLAKEFGESRRRSAYEYIRGLPGAIGAGAMRRVGRLLDRLIFGASSSPDLPRWENAAIQSRPYRP